ncbi:DUF6290 family protein [Alkalibacterium putridalgicola]|uniref:DUF6290 family protein n=1 Tax=Alkalibacterium putridalgicola TaxID=426703 RepID=UPI00115FEEB6|nr:DUF6290 family protein [Alkalibacterium putridalgicola]
MRVKVSLHLDDKEERLIKEYAKAKNSSVNALIKLSVSEKIEADLNLELYDKAMQEH